MFFSSGQKWTIQQEERIVFFGRTTKPCLKYANVNDFITYTPQLRAVFTDIYILYVTITLEVALSRAS